MAAQFLDGTELVNGIFCIPLPGRLRAANGGHDRACQRPQALRGFYAGPENRLAEFAVRAALLAQPRRYHPLVLFGPSGAGKSHLALGLATEWRQRHAEASVICRNASDFSWEVAAAIENQSLGEMSSRYEAADLVVVEDIEQLERKEAPQRVLSRIVDAMDRCGAQAVLTAGRSPTAMPWLLPPLRSRLVAGLVVPVSLPGLGARLEIIKQLAAMRCISLTPDAAHLLAAQLVRGVWHLYSALQQLQMATGSGATLARDDVGRFLSQQQSQSAPTIAAIAAATARHFGVQVRLLRTSSRRQSLVQARGVAMLLSRILTAETLDAIGRYFGGRDHTTVLHACRRTRRKLQTEPQLEHAVDAVHRVLKAS